LDIGKCLIGQAAGRSFCTIIGRNIIFQWIIICIGTHNRHWK